LRIPYPSVIGSTFLTRTISVSKLKRRCHGNGAR
jgi:hypothetical protein